MTRPDPQREDYDDARISRAENARDGLDWSERDLGNLADQRAAEMYGGA